ncbi:hypothetical protein [Streptomyces luteireticuli]
MTLIVQKYGGSSVADPGCIHRVAAIRNSATSSWWALSPTPSSP